MSVSVRTTVAASERQSSYSARVASSLPDLVQPPAPPPQAASISASATIHGRDPLISPARLVVPRAWPEYRAFRRYSLHTNRRFRRSCAGSRGTFSLPGPSDRSRRRAIPDSFRPQMPRHHSLPSRTAGRLDEIGHLPPPPLSRPPPPR